MLDGDQLVLRASMEPRRAMGNRPKLRFGQGITGPIAEHRQPVVVECRAFEDPRVQLFNELPEDYYEAFLSVPVLCRDRLVAVINLQHRFPHEHSRAEIQLVTTIGFLVGAEIELARLERENTELSERLETRKLVERAQGHLQRDLRPPASRRRTFLTIQRQSPSAGRRPKRDVAEAIVPRRRPATGTGLACTAEG